MKKLIWVLFVVLFLSFSGDSYATGISAKDKAVLCAKSPVQCTKTVAVKTGRSVYGFGNKVVRGVWGLTVGKVL